MTVYIQSQLDLGDLYEFVVYELAEILKKIPS